MVPCLPPCLLPGLQASVCAAQPGKKFARNSARETFSRAAVGGVHQYRGVSWPSQALRVGKDGRSPLSSRAAILVHAREPSPAPPLPRSLPSVPRQQSLKQPRKKRKSLEIPGLPVPREREPRGKNFQRWILLKTSQNAGRDELVLFAKFQKLPMVQITYKVKICVFCTRS